jgi:hypothetical protein
MTSTPRVLSGDSRFLAQPPQLSAEQHPRHRGPWVRICLRVAVAGLQPLGGRDGGHGTAAASHRWY